MSAHAALCQLGGTARWSQPAVVTVRAGRGWCGPRVICEYGDMADVVVRRVDFGYFVRPAQETGTGHPRVEPCLGYVVDHPRGMLLFDTGMGSHPEVDAHYRPHRAGLREALAVAGAQTSDLSIAGNCHLHFDHCGGNPLLPPAARPATRSPNSSRAPASNQ